ncbi:hypothetical protein GDO81_019423 [Engystomops pustulosus]|uniref:Uncharacterized protein n=1 Tax=Engystomops pustulosus TaxID=76066 RepID=A0AAV6YTY8_ENGPU|nr:hypothetical protein GDO81_019423 [Engystomops pustulosus]
MTSLGVPLLIWFSNSDNQKNIVRATDVVAILALRFNILASQVFFNKLSAFLSNGSFNCIASSNGRSVFFAILVTCISTLGGLSHRRESCSSNIKRFLNSRDTEILFSGSLHSSKINCFRVSFTGNTLLLFAFRIPKSSS